MIESTPRRGSPAATAQAAKRTVIILAAGLAALTTSAARAAQVTVCNEFRHPVFFAFAWQDGRDWISRGWSEVKPNHCRDNPLDADKIDVKSFYYRAETNWIDRGGGKRSMYSWGNAREFVVRDKGFTLKNADEQRSDTRLVNFSKSLDIDDSKSLTITIRSDGQNTTQETKTAKR